MYFVAAVLAVLSGLFYAASRHEIGSLGVTMCQYGSPFCDNPAARAGRRRAGCVLGRVRQRTDALASRLASSCDDAVMPVICPTCQTPRVVTRNVAKTAFFRPPIIRRFRKATAV